jgi:hypothetical protein
MAAPRARRSCGALATERRALDAIDAGADAQAVIASVRAAADAGAQDAGKPPIPDADSTVAALRPRFRQCYQRGLNVDPKMEGCVSMTARIAPDGSVTSNEAYVRDGLSDEVVSCLVGVLASARFSAPGGEGTTLNVPVTFVQAPNQ